MVDLSNNPIVAFIEGGVVVAEFLICITFCTILTSFIQSTAWETHLPDILQHVVAVINWSMSSLLVLIWITCRYLSYIKSPKEPMPPWFGLSLKRFFQPSKTSLFISFLLGKYTYFINLSILHLFIIFILIVTILLFILLQSWNL